MSVWAGCLWEASPLCGPVALLMLALGLWQAARRHDGRALALTLIALFLLGAGLAGGRRVVAQMSPVARAAGDGHTLQISGRVVSEPRATPFGSWTIMRVSAVAGHRAAGRVLLRPDEEHLAVGQAVMTVARISSLPDGPFGRYLRDAGVVATADPVGALEVGPAPALMAVTTTVRSRALRVFDAALPPTHAALLGGVVVGARDGLPTDELAATGLSHLVVVSGRHVAVLLAGVMMLTATCGLGVRGRCRLALVAVWWFVVLTRWEPSVLRAAAMATVGLVGMLCGRPRDSVHTLAMTVMVLLLIDPLLARQVGFALSVLATAGVMAALQWTGASRTLPVVLSATIGAQVATAPVLLTLAGTVPLAALPANVVAGPAAAVAQTLGLVAAGFAALQMPGAVAGTRLAGLPIGVVWWSATAFVGLPALTAGHLIALLCPPLLAVALRLPRATVAGVAVVSVAVAVVLLRLPPPAPAALQLTVFDVGQGDGLLVEAPGGPGGARMVVDGGADPEVLVGRLSARRIRALDAVVLTHGDHDHSGGLAAVLRRVNVAALLVPSGAGAPPHTLADSAVEAIGVARARSIPVIGVHAGMRFALGTSVVEVLAPPSRMRPDAERNSGSVVLRVTGRHGRILLTGDSDARAQQPLLGRPGRLHADVLKVPHHGGATNAEGFLDAVRATAAVVSLGSDNSYGHPDPTTVADLAPVPVWRTDHHGTVTLTLGPNGVTVHTDRAGSGDVYTAPDGDATSDVSVHRPRGAAAAPRGRTVARRAARRRAGRGRRPARRRSPRARHARSAHRVVVRRSSRGARPRGPRAAFRHRVRTCRRARTGTSRSGRDPAGQRHRPHHEAGKGHQGRGRPHRCRTTTRMGREQVGRARARRVSPASAQGERRRGRRHRQPRRARRLTDRREGVPGRRRRAPWRHRRT
jgi:competence protein ComEC